MKLFKCHAVMSRGGDARRHLVRAYVMTANTWQEARARIRLQEPEAGFVTVPVEASDPLLIDVEVISEREFAELRSACESHEHRLSSGQGPLGHGEMA